MKIGIDARLYSQTGVGRYLKNIISSLTALDNKNTYIIYLRSSDDYKLLNLDKQNFVKKVVNIPWHSISEQVVFPKILLDDQLDLVHFPYFNVPILYPKPYLLTIHDLIIDHFNTGRASTLPYPLYKLKRLGYKLAINSGIKKARAISVISNTTKYELIDHYGVSENDIFVTYDALDISFKKTAKSSPKKSLFPFSYILYVGNAYPHKNLELFLRAFKEIRLQVNIKFVLAGNDHFFYPRLHRYAQTIGIDKSVIFFGNANDEQLVQLYSNAKCLVFPSLMEGFGLPNLESIICGTLPVISDIPVFNEIWDKVLPMFDPQDVDSITEEIVKVLTLKKEVYKNKVRNANLIVDKYSWEESAKKTLSIYESIGNSNYKL